MWKLQSNYFPPRFHVRVPWGMKNVYGRPPKRFSFLYVLGTKILKHTQNWNDLSRFIFLYSIILWIVKYGSCLLLSNWVPLSKHTWKFTKSNWCSKVKIDLYFSKIHVGTFLRHFFSPIGKRLQQHCCPVINENRDMTV